MTASEAVGPGSIPGRATDNTACECVGSHGRFRFSKTGFDSSVGCFAKYKRPWSVPDRTRLCEGRGPGSIPGEDTFGLFLIQDTNGGVPCPQAILTNSRFFRDDEQATGGLPIRDAGRTRCPHRAWRQTPGGKARSQRSLPVWQWQSLQEMLPEERPLLMVRTEITTFREA